MIGVIFISDIAYCPYLNKYLELMDRENKKYEVLYWKREDGFESSKKNFLYFDFESEKNRPVLHKLLDFIRYRRWLKRKIKKRNYDKLILLSTLSGMIIFDELLGRYKNKYIFDIRDFSYENISLFYQIEKQIILNSDFTCISSKGFIEFLPENYSYKISHNFNKDDLSNINKFTRKNHDETLNLVFIGGVRYFKHQKQIIEKLKNDKRFNMIYHGSGIELDKFIDFSRKQNVQNIKFTGRYINKCKNILLKDADILNNSYLSDKFMEVKFAISNKYYDGIIYGIPQMVEHGTYKAKLVEKKELGISLKTSEQNFADMLYDFYHSIDIEKFNEKTFRELNKIIVEDKVYEAAIIKFINSWAVKTFKILNSYYIFYIHFDEWFVVII